MNTEQRTSMCKAFEHALQKIEAEHERFICLALPDAHPAKALIRQRLEGHFTLATWLHYEHGIPWATLETHEGQDRLRATRIAWLESLIKEFS